LVRKVDDFLPVFNQCAPHSAYLSAETKTTDTRMVTIEELAENARQADKTNENTPTSEQTTNEPVNEINNLDIKLKNLTTSQLNKMVNEICVETHKNTYLESKDALYKAMSKETAKGRKKSVVKKKPTKRKRK
jgi:hypothetical protein